MIQTLSTFALQRRYWLAFFILGFSLEAVALYYQYFLDEWPCVICIHVRIAVSAVILTSLLAMLINFQNRLAVIFHLLNTASLIFLLERSWNLLGVERGFIFGSCNMDAGLPSWLALDEWFPLVFEVQTSCGYTPELIFGITMAEALLVMSAALVLISLSAALLSFIKKTPD